MFNDKEIIIIKRNDKPEIDEYGVATYTWEEIGTYKADVQPITQEKCSRIFGNYPNVKYQVWLEVKIEGFNVTDYKMIYKGQELEILNIIGWDDDWYCANFCVGKDVLGDINES